MSASKEIQGKFVRQFITLLKHYPPLKALLKLKEDYAEEGFLEVSNLEVVEKYFPEFLKYRVKGFISYEISKAIEDLEEGKSVSQAIQRLKFLNKEIRDLLIISITQNIIGDFGEKLAGLLFKEVKLWKEIKKTLFEPIFTLILAYIALTFVIYYILPRLVQILKMMFTQQKLPFYYQILYDYLYMHPLAYIIGSVILFIVSYKVATSEWIKLKIGAITSLEKLKIFQLYSLLKDVQVNDIKTLELIAMSLRIRKWKRVFYRMIFLIENGYHVKEALNLLLKYKILTSADLGFLTTAIDSAEYKALGESAEEYLKIEIDEQIEKIKNKVHFALLILMSIIVGVIAFLTEVGMFATIVHNM